MLIASKLSLGFELRGYECGYGGALKVLPLLSLLQEAAGASADSLGFGVARLNAERRTWMLSRIALEVDRLPVEGDRITVETWPSGAERLFALRDFVLRAKDGSSLVRAVFAYLVVDVDARRPLRPENYFGGPAPRLDTPHPIEPHGFAVPRTESIIQGFGIQASPRHIDLNGHVNNTHIVDWLVDAVPLDLRGKGLAALKVEFHSEVRVGDEVKTAWCELPRDPLSGLIPVVTELRSETEPSARALTMWRQT